MLPHLQEVADTLAAAIDLSTKKEKDTDWYHARLELKSKFSKPEIVGMCKTAGMVGRMTSTRKSWLIVVLLETVLDWDGDGNLLSTSTVTTIR